MIKSLRKDLIAFLIKLQISVGIAMIDERFLLSGRATFTVSNPKGIYYTFKVVKAKFKNSAGLYSFFIKLLISPYEYAYMGVVKDYGVTLTRKSKYKKDTLPYKIADWAVNLVLLDKKLPDGYKIEHSGTCGRCGRMLTTPESIKSGLGPICRSKQ